MFAYDYDALEPWPMLTLPEVQHISDKFLELAGCSGYKEPYLSPLAILHEIGIFSSNSTPVGCGGMYIPGVVRVNAKHEHVAHELGHMALRHVGYGGIHNERTVKAIGLCLRINRHSAREALHLTPLQLCARYPEMRLTDVYQRLAMEHKDMYAFVYGVNEHEAVLPMFSEDLYSLLCADQIHEEARRLGQVVLYNDGRIAIPVPEQHRRMPVIVLLPHTLTVGRVLRCY